MEQLDTSTSIDPLIKAVYLMTRTESEYRPKLVREIVGGGPEMVRTYSNDSNHSARHRRFSRNGSIVSHTTAFETTFTGLATKLDEFSRGYYGELNQLNLDSDTLRTFKIMITTFNLRWSALPVKEDMKNILSTFQQSAARTIKTTEPKNSTIWFVYYVYFIDLLSLLQTTTKEHKADLQQERYKFCQKKIIPTISVQNITKFQFIAQVYGVDMQYITNRVMALKGACQDANILNELSAKESQCAFTQQDFAETIHFLNWKNGRDKFRARALNRFQQQSERFTQNNSRAPGVSPTDPYQTLGLIVQQMLNGFGVDSYRRLNMIFLLPLMDVM
ncbi:unnamed protein product [Ambrosiozyma monospora]|uniref:Unnamed protein product n=1 Tax=Ambrosiozyma monospora TaxID=43982 RepID=A0ACB5TFN9_AMBMO|nr:unnamed protein product [Ambrosiozyma monospora]